RPPSGAGHPVTGLPYRAGLGPCVGALVHAEHARGRRPLRVPRSADLVRRRAGMSEAALPVAIRFRQQDRASTLRWFLRKNPRMLVGVVLLSILLFVAAFAPMIAPYDPIK